MMEVGRGRGGWKRMKDEKYVSPVTCEVLREGRGVMYLCSYVPMYCTWMEFEFG